MGNTCCRADGDEVLQEKKSDAIVAGLQDEKVKRKVQELEELAFIGLVMGAAMDKVNTEKASDEEEEALFLDVLERLEKGDEFESNNHHSRELDGDDSDAASSSGGSEASFSAFDDGAEEDELPLLTASSPEQDTPLQEWELVATWNQLRRRELPKWSVAVRLIRGVALLYSKCPSSVDLGVPSLNGRIVVVGDLHGHFGDLFHILDAFGEPSDGPGGTQYLFNGDFVDRGTWGPEVLLTLYCLKLRHPGAVHFNRGNHEDNKQNQLPTNGFKHAHCTRAFPKEGAMMYQLCLSSFGQLPLCHVLGEEIAVIHGGLSLDTDVKLEEIERIHRQRGIPTHKYVIHGYREGQRIKARRDLLTGNRQPVPKGAMGTLARRFKKTDKAIAYFETFPKDPVLVTIRGAPELEEDVELVFDSEEDRRQQRSDRLFIALMWSDPINSLKNAGAKSVPNYKRGAGYCFDLKTTQAFLTTNNLRCLVRSHEKQASGSSVVQRAPDGSLAAVTVFSASNYPSGAGEPSGNKAGVLVVQQVESGAERSLAVTNSVAWREPYVEMRRWTGPKMRKSFCQLTKQANESVNHPTAKEQALPQVWLLIYCARPALLKYFNSHDTEMQGRATMEQWLSAMRACVISDDDFPWERLAPHLAHFSADGICQYGAFLRRFQNVLSRRLEARFCDSTMVQALCSLCGGRSPEEEWAAIDRNGNGRICYAEFRPLLRAHTCSHTGSYEGVGADADDDRAFALLAAMDKNLSGFVEKEEFIHAMSPVEGSEPNKKQMTQEESETIHKCWAAVHGVLRALAVSRFQVDAIFHAMDASEDGWLCREEFRSGLEEVLHGSALLSSKNDWEPLLWRLVDEDSSGHVSPEELTQALSVVDIMQRPKGAPRFSTQSEEIDI